MNKDIENYIAEYESKKRQIAAREQQINNLKLETEKQIQSLEDQIAYFNRKFEREIEPINNQIDYFQQDLNKFALSHKVLVKLGDIIDEIANITKENKENIHTEGYHTPIHYPPVKAFTTKKELIKFVTENADPITLHVSIKGKHNLKPYNLNLYFEYDLTNMWADGKTLIEHSELKAHTLTAFNSNHIINSVVFLKDEGLENLICPLNIKQIANFKNEYNTDLLATAIINCLSKNKTYENPKQKKLIKK